MAALPDPDRSGRDFSIRIRPLASQESDDLSDCTTAEERFEMVDVLTRRMWELTGRPWPSYARGDIPIRLVHRP